MFALIARAAVARDGLRDADDFEPRQSRGAQGHEQGRVQGAASAIESLSRTRRARCGERRLLQRFGESAPYLSAAAFLLVTLLLGLGYPVAEPEHIAVSQAG